MSLLLAQDRLIRKPVGFTQLNMEHPLARGLVAYWLMNESGGNKIYDLSGNGNTGVFTGTTKWASGRFGSCVYFAPGDTINLGTMPKLDGLSQITMSIWVKKDIETYGSWIPMIFKRDYANKWLEIGHGDFNSDIIVRVGNGTVSMNGITATGFFQQNIWTMLTMVFDGNASTNAAGLKLYKNGIPASLTYTGTLPTTHNSSGQIMSLRDGSESGGYNSGFSIYNRALSAQEVWQLYTEPFCIFEQPMFCFSPFSTAYAQIINDALGITDNNSRVHGALRSFTESLGVTDARIKDDGKALVDNLGITDSNTRLSVILRVLSGSLGITDAESTTFGAIRVMVESLGITDVATKNLIALRVLSENIGITDSTAQTSVIDRLISDLEGITDGTVLDRTMVVANTLGITDDISRILTYLRTQDNTVGLMDSMTRVATILRTINNNVGITDVEIEQLNQLFNASAFVILRQSTN